MDLRSQVQVAGGLSVVAGLWLIVSPWVLGFSNARTPTVDVVVVGAVVGALALMRARGAPDAEWLSWLNALVALWLVVSPWALKFAADRTPFWNALALGVIVFVLNVYAAAAGPRTSVREPR